MPLNLLDYMPPENPSRARRLCICLSDIHCTDGTVGQQSADPEIWPWTFSQIRQLCETFSVTHLYLILAGDIVDMIRTRQWVNPEQHGELFPWETEVPGYARRLQSIFDGILERHARPEGSLFHQLQQARSQWPGDLLPRLETFTVIPILGNHDKEILRDKQVLRGFWEQLLGISLKEIPSGYRKYLSEQYGMDFTAPDSAPWPPFYWMDSGFRLLATHGQWRDPDNHATTEGWSGKDGWRPETWQREHYRPFTASCFGDTVAAGLLSGYISITKERLLQDAATAGPNRDRILNILDELDLYRPSYAAVERLEQEVRRLAQEEGHQSARHIKKILEDTLLEQVQKWLGWRFTRLSTSAGRRAMLEVARFLVDLKRLGPQRGLKLQVIYKLFRLLHWFNRHQDETKEMPTRQLLHLPAFSDPGCQALGLQLHVEGHTHTPLEADLDIGPHKNRSYINLGTWRNRVVKKRVGSYRRRGVGRMLCILDLPGEEERDFSYWVIDFTQWKDRADDLTRKPSETED